jgi:hypothetical protein
MDLLAYVMAIIISDPQVSLKTQTILFQPNIYILFVHSACIKIVNELENWGVIT